MDDHILKPSAQGREHTNIMIAFINPDFLRLHPNWSIHIAIIFSNTASTVEKAANVIKTKNQFIEYVAFILGDDYVQSFLENKKSSGKFGEWEQNSAMPAVYEKMLKTSVSDPERLGEIQYITKAIEEEEIIPPEFREMYEVFCNTFGIKQV